MAGRGVRARRRPHPRAPAGQARCRPVLPRGPRPPWYTSQRENREVPTEEAAATYIEEILTTLPDELLGDLATVGGELRDKYDPSKGFVDEDDDEEPYDPWEDGANDPDVELRDTFDIFALRAKAAAKEKKA